MIGFLTFYIKTIYLYIVNTPKCRDMNNVYLRSCPICNVEISYTNKRCWYNANRANAKCKKCQNSYTKEIVKAKIAKGEMWGGVRNKERENTLERPHKRNCPNCNIEMGYARKNIRDTAEKRKTICNSCSTKIYKKGVINGVTNQQTLQMRATKAGFDNWEEYVEKYPKKQFYKREVWRYTYKNPLNELEHWEKRGRCGVEGAYQLDHIQSINWGWENGIPAQQIADWNNLRMIPWKDNRDKW
jgi:hypothetical protein